MKNQNSSRVAGFFKRNLVYFILALCILAVGLSVTLMLINRSEQLEAEVPDIINPDNGIIQDDPVIKPDDNVNDTPVINPNPEPDLEPVIVPIEFIMPVANASSIGEYSEVMVFNGTLNRFTAHLAIDFFAPEGTDVLAVYGGTIESVENTILHGTVVTIDHGDGLKTVYNSLADGDSVTVGQKVNKGDVIGQVSVTNRQEYKSGAHVHFEVIENGEKIDPIKYLALEEK